MQLGGLCYYLYIFLQYSLCIVFQHCSSNFLKVLAVIKRKNIHDRRFICVKVVYMYTDIILCEAESVPDNNRSGKRMLRWIRLTEDDLNAIYQHRFRDEEMTWPALIGEKQFENKKNSFDHCKTTGNDLIGFFFIQDGIIYTGFERFLNSIFFQNIFLKSRICC